MWCLLLPTVFFSFCLSVHIFSSFCNCAICIFGVCALRRLFARATYQKKRNIFNSNDTCVVHSMWLIFYVYTRDENDFNLIIMSQRFVCWIFPRPAFYMEYMCPGQCWRTNRIYYEQCHIVARTLNTIFPYAFKPHSGFLFPLSSWAVSTSIAIMWNCTLRHLQFDWCGKVNAHCLPFGNDPNANEIEKVFLLFALFFTIWKILLKTFPICYYTLHESI